MNFYDKLKDFLYDSVDYFFMVGILVVVVVVIGWRLDVLFEKDTVSAQPSDQVVVDNSSREDFLIEITPDITQQEEEVPLEIKEPAVVPAPTEQVTTNPEPPQTPPPSVESVKITIPAGAMPGKIGLILEESGLIVSSRDFIAKAVELKLDTKLKSGTYSINKSLSLDDIVKMMTK
jgi:hypothetical protein